MIWIETPSNPLLKLADLEALAALARKHRLIAVADNTFATPYVQRPLELGFDIVVHSVTKYLNGHSDMIGGMAVVGQRQDLAEQLGFLQNAVGGISGPFDSFLALRGLKTLALRMERHCATRRASPPGSSAGADVARVHYPGLSSHPQHALGPTANARLRRHGFRRAGRRRAALADDSWNAAGCSPWPKAWEASKA